jgi:histone H2B
VKILNSFVFDMFDKIATQAAELVRANKTSTIRGDTIAAAVKLTLPADLGKHAIAEAAKTIKA